MGNPTTYPGVIDLYDLNEDCRHPQLLSSAPVGVLGHESGWSPDGNTFYATSLVQPDQVTAVDVSDPRAPVPITTFPNPSHGFTISEDGNRGYAAGLQSGLIVVDTSEIQARRPAPQVREVSRLRWPTLSIPQVAIPIRLGGRPHLLEVDEFSVNSDDDLLPVSNGQRVGAARIIDISDERAPRVVSDLRLEVNQPEHRATIAGDPGASFLGPGLRAGTTAASRARTTRRSSRARSSPPACASSTSAIRAIRGRSRTSSRRRRRARPTASVPTTRCPSRPSTSSGGSSGTPTSTAACTACG